MSDGDENGGPGPGSQRVLVAGAPGIPHEEADDVFVGHAIRPETLTGLYDDGVELVFSSIGISRQRDGMSFDQVDYQANRSLLELCAGSGVGKTTLRSYFEELA